MSRKEKTEFLTSVKRDEIAALVKEYYVAQEHRIRLDAQIRSLQAPTEFMRQRADAWRNEEKIIKKVLDWWTAEDPVTAWARQFRGVGPVITAGFRSMLDLTKPHVASIWQFCGLTPAAKLVKGQRANYSRQAKRLAWLLANSFEKMAARFQDRLDEPSSYYLKLWTVYRRREDTRNKAGHYVDLAREKLAKSRNASAETKALWEQGRLTPGHLRLRAMRCVAQIFLAHFHEVGHWYETGKAPSEPYCIAHLGHDEKLPVPLPPGFVAGHAETRLLERTA